MLLFCCQQLLNLLFSSQFSSNKESFIVFIFIFMWIKKTYRFLWKWYSSFDFWMLRKRIMKMRRNYGKKHNFEYLLNHIMVLSLCMRRVCRIGIFSTRLSNEWYSDTFDCEWYCQLYTTLHGNMEWFIQSSDRFRLLR